MNANTPTNARKGTFSVWLHISGVAQEPFSDTSNGTMKFAALHLLKRKINAQVTYPKMRGRQAGVREAQVVEELLENASGPVIPHCG